MLAPWTADETSACGQVFEFRLWAELTDQSRGQLHVFLPLTDRGVDGLVHSMADGSYTPVQAKARSRLVDGEVHLNVVAESVIHDDVVIVGGLVADGGLGPTLLVVPAPEFRRLAYLTSNHGTSIYSMEFGMRPRSDSKWLPWLVPSGQLAERFGLVGTAIRELAAERPPSWRSDVGFLGEAEVMRRLAENGDLNLFRAFPDLETVEIPVLHLITRRVLGLQVKTVDMTADRMRATVNVRASSFKPAPTTDFVVLAWLKDELRFHDACLLIPSQELARLGHDDGNGHISFDFRPGAPDSAFALFSRPLASLTSEVAKSLSR
ncbi:MAG: hypothetical protein E6I34_07385 [Chloroflexi bacterium]|nr:MAG: hypothetical protein E6I34_07385 [Chloroflexota bacterium]